MNRKYRLIYCYSFYYYSFYCYFIYSYFPWDGKYQEIENVNIKKSLIRGSRSPRLGRQESVFRRVECLDRCFQPDQGSITFRMRMLSPSGCLFRQCTAFILDQQQDLFFPAGGGVDIDQHMIPGGAFAVKLPTEDFVFALGRDQSQSGAADS